MNTKQAMYEFTRLCECNDQSKIQLGNKAREVWRHLTNTTKEIGFDQKIYIIEQKYTMRKRLNREFEQPKEDVVIIK